MRHRKKFNHLGRTASHRSAMLSNMATSLIVHKRIKTTVAKAKALRIYVEPIISRSKEDTTHSRRMVFRKLQNKDAVNELFREISAKVMDRPGGYTRILKTGNRLGDNAEMCIIELVDYNENLLKDKSSKKTKAKRSRRGSSKKAALKTETTTAIEDAVIVEETTAEVKEEVKAEPKAEKKAEPKTEKKAEPKAAKKEVKAVPKKEVTAEAKEEKKEAPKAESKEDKKEDK
ncbi:MAG: 50S ribosomal protein L17 [Bacteroidetes bacterium]|nr:MAG: 50S ribosomal protein L17 [Bacteroidota bacterium]